MVIRVAMWNMGPQFRYTYPASTRCRLAIISDCVTIACWLSSAPLGVPVKAAV